ncbi:MAG TPA: hypothetical protein VIL74_01095 [Pyrinomonadaceae bacterium]
MAKFFLRQTFRGNDLTNLNIGPIKHRESFGAGAVEKIRFVAVELQIRVESADAVEDFCLKGHIAAKRMLRKCQKSFFFPELRRAEKAAHLDIERKRRIAAEPNADLASQTIAFVFKKMLSDSADPVRCRPLVVVDISQNSSLCFRPSAIARLA